MDGKNAASRCGLWATCVTPMSSRIGGARRRAKIAGAESRWDRSAERRRVSVCVVLPAEELGLSGFV